MNYKWCDHYRATPLLWLSWLHTTKGKLGGLADSSIETCNGGRLDVKSKKDNKKVVHFRS